VEFQLHRPLLPVAKRKYVREAFVSAILLYCIWWNFTGANFLVPPMPAGSRWIGDLLRVDQHWGMFAPVVFKDDGWYVLEGKTARGQTIDLNQQGKAADYSKPASVVSLFKNDRWRKYSENYLFIHNGYMRPYYCNYLVRRWNEAHPQQPIKELQVIYMKEPSLPDYRLPVPTKEVLCSCANLP